MAGTVFAGNDGELEPLAGILRGDPGSAVAALVSGRFLANRVVLECGPASRIAVGVGPGGTSP